MAPIDREFDFIPGPETSTLPDVSDPSADGDTVSLGYLLKRSPWADDAASYAAIRALGTTERADYQKRFVTGTEELWYFNPSSTAVDDGATILTPDDAPVSGRWLILQMGGGGGGGSGTSGRETLQQKLENEKSGIFTEELDNSVSMSPARELQDVGLEATLLETASSGQAVVSVVWNAKVNNSGDSQMDSTTGWTAVNAGTTLTATTTAGEFKVGTAGLKFDKDSSATEAAIRYDIGAQTLGIAGNTEVWVWCKLPSITQLSNVFLRMFADSTSNYRTFTTTTDYAGSALAIGWNLLKFSVASGGTASGSGWVYSELSRYQSLGVTTSVSGQTYTGIIFDALYFGISNPERIGVIGNTFDLFNTSTVESVVVASSNTRHQGPLTMTANLANSYSGGLTNSARGRVKRSTLVASGELLVLDEDASLSGTVTLSQRARAAAILRESVSKDYAAFVDQIPHQLYEVTAVGGSTIDVSDPANDSANLLNTDVMHIFTPKYINGKRFFTQVATRSLTANSSHSSGTTTLTLTTTSISVGDFVAKKSINSIKASVVGLTNNEALGTITAVSAPNDVQLLDTGLAYPNRAYVSGHYYLGAVVESEALKNRFGVLPSLTNVGGNFGAAFLKGRLAANGFTSTDRYSLSETDSRNYLSGNASYTSRVQVSAWIYHDGAATSGRVFFSRYRSSLDNGWIVQSSGSGGFTFNFFSGGSLTGSYARTATANAWNHVVLSFSTAGGVKSWVNGVYTDHGSSIAIGDPAAGNQAFGIGNADQQGSWGNPMNPSGDLRIADLVIWTNGPELTQAQVNYLYGRGNYQPVGSGPILRSTYALTGANGQKVSMEVGLARSTTAVKPNIYKAGLI